MISQSCSIFEQVPSKRAAVCFHRLGLISGFIEIAKVSVNTCLFHSSVTQCLTRRQTSKHLTSNFLNMSKNSAYFSSVFIFSPKSM